MKDDQVEIHDCIIGIANQRCHNVKVLWHSYNFAFLLPPPIQRKNEEAAALSKRLNENLLKQRKAFEDRSKKDSNQSETKRARIIKLLNQELDVVVDVEEARQHKEELVNDRKELSEQLAHLQGQSVNRCKR